MNNLLYNSGAVSSSQNFNYNFKERSGKLKWKEVLNLDLDNIVRNGDLSPLENFLENLIFANIDENDLSIVPEQNTVKLIKMYQYIMEYFLFTQQKLESENKLLEGNYSSLLNDAQTKEQTLKDNKSLINNLRREKKEKELILNTYRTLIDEYKAGKLQGGSVDLSKQLVKEKTYFYCDICEGKKFSSEENLENHISRRHKQEQRNNIENKFQSTVNDKFDQMKSYIDTFVKNQQTDSYIKLFENQKNLENKIIELKSSNIPNYLNNSISPLNVMAQTGYLNTQNNNNNNNNNNLEYINSLERTFKDSLVEMKDLFLNANKNNQVKNNEESEAVNKINKEALEAMKANSLLMNKMIAEMKKAQDDKLQEVNNQLSDFKGSIIENLKKQKDEKEKKKKKKESSEDEKEKKKDKKKKKDLKDNSSEDESKIIKNSRRKFLENENKITIAKNTNIEIYSLSKTKEEQKAEIISFNHKKIFNSGPIESDNDEEELTIMNNDKHKKNEVLLIASHAADFHIEKERLKKSDTMIGTNISVADLKASKNSLNRSTTSVQNVKKSLLESITEDMVNIKTQPEFGNRLDEGKNYIFIKIT